MENGFGCGGNGTEAGRKFGGRLTSDGGDSGGMNLVIVGLTRQK